MEDKLYFYKAIVTKVTDGDTIVLDIDVGFNFWLKGESVRFLRINAYETRLGSKTTAEMKIIGLKAKEYVKNLIENKEVIIKTKLDGNRGKYGRILVEVYYFKDEELINLNDELVKLSYAVYQQY